MQSDAKSTTPSLDQATSELVEFIKTQGFRDVRVLPDGSIAMLLDLMYTRAICLGGDRCGYSDRFCFDDKSLADQRFRELQSEDDTPRGYIAKRLGSRRSVG